MRRFSLLVLATLTLVTPARADLRFAKPRADLGEIKSGPALVQRFAFVNDGTQPIEIREAKTSCGCLKPRFLQMNFKPGEEGWVEVEVNTLSQPPGPNAWRVDIKYQNGAQPAEAAVLVSARLTTEVMVEPATLNISTSQALTHEIAVTDLRAKPLNVTAVRSTSPHLKPVLKEPCKDLNGHAVRFVQLEVAADCPEGKHEEIVTIYTDDPAYRELKVATTVVKRPRQRVLATPSEVALSAPTAQALPARIVIVRDADGQNVTVAKVAADDPALTARWAQGPGTNATVRIQVDAEKLGNRNLQTNVHVHVTQPVPQELTIPVRVTIEH